MTLYQAFSQWQHSFQLKAVLPLAKRFVTVSHHINKTWNKFMCAATLRATNIDQRLAKFPVTPHACGVTRNITNHCQCFKLPLILNAWGCLKISTLGGSFKSPLKILWTLGKVSSHPSKYRQPLAKFQVTPQNIVNPWWSFKSPLKISSTLGEVSSHPSKYRQPLAKFQVTPQNIVNPWRSFKSPLKISSTLGEVSSHPSCVQHVWWLETWPTSVLALVC